MKKHIILLVIIYFPASHFSQINDAEIILKTKNGIPKLINFKEPKSANFENTIFLFKKLFKPNSNIDFLAEKKISPKINGFSSQKYNQYYKGLKVEFARLNTIIKNNKIHTINGSFIKVENLNIIPSINRLNVINIVKKNVEGIILKPNKINPKLIIIRENVFDENSKPVLAYKILINTEKPLSKFNIYINACDGSFIYKNYLIHSVEGTAHTRYSGTRIIETTPHNNLYKLIDNTRGNGIQTGNANNLLSASYLTNYYDNNNIWTSSEYDNFNRDNSALDIHWGVEKT